MYHKEGLSFPKLSISNLPKCLVYEAAIQNKKGYFTLHHSPSQNYDDFLIFLKTCQTLLSGISQECPKFNIIMGDFDPMSTTWWYVDKASLEGMQIEASTSFQEFEQVRNEPTHNLPNSLSSINLILIDKANLKVDSSTLHSLLVNCHHQIVYMKHNFSITYPPSYQCIIWNYKKEG